MRTIRAASGFQLRAPPPQKSATLLLCRLSRGALSSVGWVGAQQRRQQRQCGAVRVKPTRV